jgi:hypothetical protein
MDEEGGTSFGNEMPSSAPFQARVVCFISRALAKGITGIPEGLIAFLRWRSHMMTY